MLGPWVVLLERDLPGVGQLGIVAQPVVDLELDPGPGQQVERRRGLEPLAREQPPADQARVRVEQALRLLGVDVFQRHVPPEPAPERAHERIVEVVVGAVDHPRTEVAADVGVLEGRRVERPAPGVVEVLLPEPVAKADQNRDGGDRRQPGPAERPVDLLGEVGDKPGQLPRHACALSSYRAAVSTRATVLGAMKHPGRAKVKSPGRTTDAAPERNFPDARIGAAPDAGRACAADTPRMRSRYADVMPGAMKAMVALVREVRRSPLEHALVELVKIRASQLNGCAYLRRHPRPGGARPGRERSAPPSASGLARRAVLFRARAGRPAGGARRSR